MGKILESKIDMSDCLGNLNAKISFMQEACISIAQRTESFSEDDAFGMHLMFEDIKNDVASIFAVIRDDLKDK